MERSTYPDDAPRLELSGLKHMAQHVSANNAFPDEVGVRGGLLPLLTGVLGSTSFVRSRSGVRNPVSSILEQFR